MTNNYVGSVLYAIAAMFLYALGYREWGLVAGFAFASCYLGDAGAGLMKMDYKLNGGLLYLLAVVLAVLALLYAIFIINT